MTNMNQSYRGVLDVDLHDVAAVMFEPGAINWSLMADDDGLRQDYFNEYWIDQATIEGNVAMSDADFWRTTNGTSRLLEAGCQVCNECGAHFDHHHDPADCLLNQERWAEEIAAVAELA